MTSRRVFVLCAGLVLGVIYGPAQADEDAVFGQALEMPAHRTLIEMRNRPGVVPGRFESDGCSGGLSQTWRLVADQFEQFARVHEKAPPWESCCVTHDRAYFDGAGAETAQASFSARLMADQQLEACVVNMGITRRDELAKVYAIRPDQVETAYATIGGAMFWAVRFGGGPCTGLPWRWGFGYPDCSVFGVTGN
jgi:hypothetical protein